MRFIIPTYHRPDYIKTPLFLVEHGVSPKDISICFQDLEDMRSYDRDLIPKGCELIINDEADSAAANRNTGIRAHLGETVCVMDDDITGLSMRFPAIEQTDNPAPFRGKGIRHRHVTPRGFWKIMNLWEQMITDDPSRILTINVTDNSGLLCRSDWPDRFIDTVTFVSQVFAMAATEDHLFDESYYMAEDIEFGARMIRNGTPIIRDRAIIPATQNRIGNRVIPGGISDVVDRRFEFFERLTHEYEDLILWKNGWNIPRMKVRGRVQHINTDTPVTCDDVMMSRADIGANEWAWNASEEMQKDDWRSQQ